MVKSAKLWREMSRQYGILAQAEAGREAAAQHRGHAGTGLGAAVQESSRFIDAAASDPQLRLPRAEPSPVPSFYQGGLQHKHWVLVLASLMVLCEWMDRTLLSVAMQAMKVDFQLNDTQIGMMASSSLWMVPIAIVFAGRLSDHVPKSKLLGLGLLGWGGCTILTGSARSFKAVIISRLLAGLSNCAGYPVAVALLAEFFGPADLTTALGYFNAGCAVGGLLGLAVGGLIITQVGWRWAFWGTGAPQLFIALLLATTVRDQQQLAPRQPWLQDLRGLLRLPSLRLMMLGSILQGVVSGNNRFLSSLVERTQGVNTQTIGSVMGITLGVTGVFSAWCGGHAVDRWVTKTQDCRWTLWCACAGDILHMVWGLPALFAPNFGIQVVFLALSTWSASLTLGVHTANQMLAIGRRGTTQSLFELCWSVGMGCGPFLSGSLSDLFSDSSCGQGCSLQKAVTLVAGLGYSSRVLAHLSAAAYFPEDAKTVEAEQGAVEAEQGADGSSPKCQGDDSTRTITTPGNSSSAWSTVGERTPECSVGRGAAGAALEEAGPPEVTILGRSADLRPA